MDLSPFYPEHDNFLKNKLVSSTLRTILVKLIYSPTCFVRLSRTSSGSFTNESYRLVFIHSVNRTDYFYRLFLRICVQETS